MKGHNGAVRYVDFSHKDHSENSVLVTCSDDKTLKLWSLPSKKFRASLVGHTNWVRSCKFSPDSKFIISGSDDGMMKLWDVNSGENVVSYKFPSSIIKTSTSSTFESTIGVRNAQFHPSGNLFAASGSNGNVHLYDLRSDKIIHSFPELNSPTSISMGLSFHHGGNHLMTCNCEGSFTLWNLRKMRCAFSIRHDKKGGERERSQAYCCGFDEDGSHFATGGIDKRILVWKYGLGHETEKKRLDRTTLCHPKSNETKIVRNKSTTQSVATEKRKEESGQICKIEEPNDEINEPIAEILNDIMGQLKLLTNTMTRMEKRISVLEESTMKNKDI